MYLPIEMKVQCVVFNQGQVAVSEHTHLLRSSECSFGLLTLF